MLLKKEIAWLLNILIALKILSQFFGIHIRITTPPPGSMINFLNCQASTRKLCKAMALFYTCSSFPWTGQDPLACWWLPDSFQKYLKFTSYHLSVVTPNKCPKMGIYNTKLCLCQTLHSHKIWVLFNVLLKTFRTSYRDSPFVFRFLMTTEWFTLFFLFYSSSLWERRYWHGQPESSWLRHNHP